MKNRNPERRLAVILTAVFLIHFCLAWQWPSPARGQQSVAPRRVLVLYWYNRDFLWNVEFDQSFKLRLDSALPGSIEYYQEYLESDRFPGEPQARLLRDYLRKKYAEHPIDVLVATSDASLEFLIKDHSGLFPGVPIVFVATQYPTTAETMTEPGLTGIINIATHRRTVDLALSLHPTTEQVFVVSGTLEHDKRLERLAREELQGYEGRVQITYLTDLSSAQLVEKMESLPKRSIVLYVWEQSKNEQGKVLESVDLFTLIAPHAHVPIYGMLLPLVGRGVVGGYINTGAAAGTKIAEIVLRIATGTRAVNIPVERAPAEPIFDWRELRRWGVRENKLPHESLIRFRELTLWDQYKWRILGIVVLILVQTMLIWGLLIQRRMRRKLYTELQRSEFYLAEGQRLGHTGSWALNPSGFFEYWSQELFQIYGLDPQKGAPTVEQYLATIHPQDRQFMAETVKRMCEQGSGCDVKKRIIRPDGAVRYVRCVSVPVLDNGVLKGFLGTAMDVTEQEQLTQELQSREAYLAEAQRLSHTGSFGWKPDTGEIVWSDETYRIFEYDRSVKPTIDSLMQRVHAQDRPDFQRVIDGASRGETDFEHAYRLLLPDGRVKHVRAIAHAVQNASGDREFVGAASDITERKTTEDKIRRLVEADILGIFIANVEGKIVEANQAFLQMLQYGRQDLVSGRLRWTDLTPAELRARDERALTEALATGVFQPYEKEFLRKDGCRVPVLIGGALFESANEGVVFVLDLSEQKRAEEALRSSEAYLAEAQRLTHTGSCAVDGTSREIRYWSEEMFRLFDFDPQQGLPTWDQWQQRIHPEDREKFRMAGDRTFLEKVHCDVEFRTVKSDGTVKQIHGIAHPIVGPNGELVQVLGTMVDVTERRRAEEKIRQSEKDLRQILDLAPQLVAVYGPNLERLYANHVMLDYVGFSLDEWRQTPETFFSSPLCHPDDRERAARTFSDSARFGGSAFELELRIPKRDGPYRWFLVRFNPLLDDKGQIMRWYVAGTDIEDRKRTEDKAREQEAELRQIVDLALQQVRVYGPSGERLYANRIALDYYGVSLEEWRQTPGHSFRSSLFVHPDDQERAARDFDANSASGSAYELEARVRGADGNYRWFLVRHNPLHDDKGQVKRWYVALTDIDERKRAEERLQQENVALREEIDKASMFEEIVGTSPALKSALSRISKVAPSDSTVLITGETGTGKELVARAIHRRSDRASRPFVSTNCAAIPRDLIASELFGHEKGAFTGAAQQRLGRFELANGGTLFLDEVGELPAETQIALLRVLQEHEFERVGGTRPIRADVRVIAATNRNLQAAISAGSFRSDLFYRLNVFPIEIPPLRERREDIPLLMEYFIDRYARKAGKRITTVDKTTLQVLQSYPWPGNIRELQNVIERSVIVCETANFSVDESWLSRQPIATEPNKEPALFKRLPSREKTIIEAALRETGGRVSGPSGAAVKLGIPGSTLDSKIRSLKIDKNRFKLTDPPKDRS